MIPLVASVRELEIVRQAIEQFVHHPARDARALRGVDEPGGEAVAHGRWGGLVGGHAAIVRRRWGAAGVTTDSPGCRWC